ncbi:MAG TPA: class I SAM-dependent methyltransferase [Micromonosporaceae bacterium]|nr:class I SAM-dependent methyltransferase [Micromonosporaceae bacterium]
MVHGPSSWDQSYLDGSPPWDIGRPQPAFVRVADRGQVRSPVLDSGCGTGEHALLFAERGFEVTGVDIAAPAIEAARAKAAQRGLSVTFEVADVLALDRHGFATVLDNGVFHVFDDADRARYVASLAAATRPGGMLYLQCFSDQEPGDDGPRRITQAELRAAFANGWRVLDIEATRIDVRPEFRLEPARAWFATIVRDA